VRRFDHVAPADHPALFSSSRLTLNITRAEMAANGWCPSGRFFEAAACSTPVITDCWPGLEDFFTLGDEVIVARNTEDVLAALQLSDAELQAIASRARERTLDQHTGDCRARELLSYLGSSRTAAKEEKLEMAL
jgi:spore maturation protein CgeB